MKLARPGLERQSKHWNIMKTYTEWELQYTQTRRVSLFHFPECEKGEIVEWNLHFQTLEEFPRAVLWKVGKTILSFLLIGALIVDRKIIFHVP